MSTKKRSKSTNEILLFLVRNSEPEYHKYVVEGEEIHLDPPRKKTKKQKIADLCLSLSGTTRYLCDLEKFEQFVGEKFHFEKHLREIADEGILFFDGLPKNGDFYDSPKYREIFAAGNGLVQDYDTNYDAKKSYIAFHYKENNFLDDYNNNIMKNAKELGLV